MPCSPNDVSLAEPTSSSAPAIPGFGIPFSLPLPVVSPFPSGFPEDLLNIFNTFQFLIPPGALKPSLNPNFGKDVFDGIMKMLDQFMPFLMLYKFFLPILNIIICVIEVLCALMNPFALISAINRLFNQCIPQFLNIFPVFAIIIMLISLLLLIIALIEYIASQILKLVQALLRNIAALTNAFNNDDATGVMAIAQKLGSILCIFQNVFVLLSVFNVIIDIVKDILGMAFAIPPCQDGPSGDANSCCTPDTCPTIVKAPYTRTTGTFKYFGEVGGSFDTPGGGGFPAQTFSFRNEMWQFYDTSQKEGQAFSNIYNAFDITDTTTKPVFFPAGATYPLGSDLKQVPYTINLRVFYVPANWGRTGPSRFVRFNNCIITTVPTPNLVEANNSTETINNAVAVLTGGSGFEDDDTTPLQAYGSNGTTPISGTATLNNFFHQPATFSNTYLPPNINDGYTFQNVDYTFTPNIAPLIKAGLVTLGCAPSVAFSKDFINNVFASDVGIQTAELNNLINGGGFPDPNAAEACMLAAIAALRSNMTNEGVAQFQATCNICLGNLQTATNNSLNNLIGIGIDPCSSSFTVTPAVQFTSEPIIVSVNINERNGLPITNGLPAEVANNLAARLSAHLTVGEISPFSYDGYQLFVAKITSPVTGSGQISISFDNNVFCTNTFSATEPAVHTLQAQNYQFIYTPTEQNVVRRDLGDVARDGKTGGT
jgi:hypothetical protein